MAIAPGIRDITQGIISSHDARMAWEAERKRASAELKKELTQGVAARKSEVKGMLNDFEASHKAMSTELRKGLAQGEAERKKASAELKKGLTQGVAVRKSEVKDMLGDFQRSRKQTSAQLRRELADYDRGIKSEVAKIRQETQADLRQASATWQGLAETMRAKRSGVKAPPKVKPTVEEKVEVPPAEEQIPDLEAKLLDAVREHPEGITLTEVAGSLGVAPIVLGRASRKLVDEGKIRKEDKDYFPVSTE